MQQRIKIITQPAIEPVTAAEVKLHTHISGTTEDTLLEKWIKSARIQAEAFMNQAFIGRIIEMSFDCFPDCPIEIPYSPLMQLISIKYFDYLNAETTLYYDGTDPIGTTEEGGEEPTTNSDFIVDVSGLPGRIGLAYEKSWPVVTLRPIDAVRVRSAVGYGLTAADVPDNVKDAIMLYCTYRNENRAGEFERAPKQFFDLLRFDR